MRFRIFILPLALLTLLLVAGLAQGPKGTAPAGPMVWSAFLADDIPIATAYGRPGLPSKVFASFTPFGDITVTRIQAEVGIGPHVSAISGYERCSVPPSIRVTNGSTSYTLPLAEPRNLQLPHGGSSSDSGPLDLVFPANGRIEMILLPPAEIDFPNHWCDIQDVNLTVQYRTR
jgi:hypothetical protein